MILIILLILAGVAYSQYSNKEMEIQNSWVLDSPSMVKNQAKSSSMMDWDRQSQRTKDEIEIMEKDSMMSADNKAETMIKKDTGYQMYSEALVDSALKSGQKVAIFFHASWCPSCRALERTLTSNASQIPQDTIILQANYDTETALKQKYGVTVQTTVITLKSDGSLDQKMIGPKTLADILK